MGAVELSRLYKTLQKRYGDYIKLFGISPSFDSLKEFKSLKFFQYPIFIPKRQKDFYEVFKFESPGILKCYGLCNKNIIKRYKKASKSKLGYDFKGKLSSLGGTFIVNNKGKVLYYHYEKFLGDNQYIDEINNKFEEILGTKLNFNKGASKRNRENYFDDEENDEEINNSAIETSKNAIFQSEKDINFSQAKNEPSEASETIKKATCISQQSI